MLGNDIVSLGRRVSSISWQPEIPTLAEESRASNDRFPTHAADRFVSPRESPSQARSPMSTTSPPGTTSTFRPACCPKAPMISASVASKNKEMGASRRPSGSTGSGGPTGSRRHLWSSGRIETTPRSHPLSDCPEGPWPSRVLCRTRARSLPALCRSRAACPCGAAQPRPSPRSRRQRQ